MQDEAIVIDDEPTTPNGRSQADVFRESISSSGPAARIRLVSRTRAGSQNLNSQSTDPSSSRTPGAKQSGNKKGASGLGNAGAAAPKLKVKLGGKAGQPGLNTSFLGPYDRELDSDDEDLAFEEQFILRMPEGEDCESLRKMVQARDVKDDVWFKFSDSRRGVFHIGDSTYSSKLVDLPCIIEAQKTLDSRQMFKVADICQMLVVQEKLDSDNPSAPENRSFNIDDFIWPHGITPPLKHVRKRRFRKRVNRTTIETTEQEVERLLAEDEKAQEVKFDILENVDPDLSDSEYDNEPTFDPGTPGAYGSEAGDVGTPFPDDEQEDDGAPSGDQGETGGDEDDDELFGFGAELEAEMARAMAEDDASEDGAEDNGLFGNDDNSSDEDDDEDEEVVQSRKLLDGEIEDLRAAIEKKENEIVGAVNPLIKRRFEDALKKLRVDYDGKIAQRQALTERKRAAEEERARMEDDEGGLANDEDEEEDGEPASGPSATGAAVPDEKTPPDTMEVD